MNTYTAVYAWIWCISTASASYTISIRHQDIRYWTCRVILAFRGVYRWDCTAKWEHIYRSTSRAPGSTLLASSLGLPLANFLLSALPRLLGCGKQILKHGTHRIQAVEQECIRATAPGHNYGNSNILAPFELHRPFEWRREWDSQPYAQLSQIERSGVFSTNSTNNPSINVVGELSLQHACGRSDIPMHCVAFE